MKLPPANLAAWMTVHQSGQLSEQPAAALPTAAGQQQAQLLRLCRPGDGSGARRFGQPDQAKEKLVILPLWGGGFLTPELLELWICSRHGGAVERVAACSVLTAGLTEIRCAGMQSWCTMASGSAQSG